jgi:hypothetical protein
MATSSRPSEITSMAARSWANTAGCRKSLLKTNAPTRSVLVAAAIAVIATSGDSWSNR